MVEDGSKEWKGKGGGNWHTSSTENIEKEFTNFLAGVWIAIEFLVPRTTKLPPNNPKHLYNKSNNYITN